MSNFAINWAREQTIASPTARTILREIADRADKETGQCYRSRKQLADATGLSMRSIIRWLDWLHREGFIERSERHRPDGSRAADLYTLPAAARAEGGGDSLSPGGVTESPGGDRESPLKPTKEPKHSLSGARAPDSIGKGPVRSRREQRRGPGEGQRELFPARAVVPGQAGNAPPAPSPSRIAADWQPSETDRAAAIGLGIPPVLIDAEADKFRDHHIARGATAADWPARWRTWCRRGAEHLARNPATTGGPDGPRPDHARARTSRAERFAQGFARLMRDEDEAG